MTIALSLLCRVIQRRVEKGETPEEVLADYPKLTSQEREEIAEALRR